jgi:hypothetical protein
MLFVQSKVLSVAQSGWEPTFVLDYGMVYVSTLLLLWHFHLYSYEEQQVSSN